MIRQPWTEADVAALIELNDSCTEQQMAAYLQRSVRSVKHKRAQLIKTGQIERKSMGPKSPFVIGRGAVLIAKSCPGCGLLRDAKFYARRNNKGTAYLVKCSRCLSRLASKRRTPTYLRRDYPSMKNLDLLQEITFQQASNENQPYTEDEVLQLKDPSNNELSLALTLQRSYNAIRHKRYRLGIRHPRNVDNSSWSIDFPAAMETLRRHFEELGKPMPEQLWDWNDDERIAS